MKKKVKSKSPSKRFLLKNRRGEMTTQQLVVLIILIASFAIILFLLWRMNFGETSNEEICHNSVVLKSKGGGLAGSLNCKTSYVCITKGGECPDFNPTETIEVKNKNEIMKAIADEISTCWWMFGEGDANYGEGLASSSVHCALCSVIKFDDETEDITYKEFYEYLSKTKKDETQTYLKYLYGIDDLASLKIKEPFKININTEIISAKEKYSIITGVDNNLLLWEDTILDAYLINSKQTSELGCGDFITKA